MRGLVATAIVLAAAGGCSLGALSGFSGGAAEETGDGGTDVATIDSMTSDPDADDGAVDVATAFDCDAGAFLFCAPFDDGVLANGWDLTFTKFGGTLALSNDARSNPFALRAQLPAMTTTDFQYARLYKAVAGAKPVRIAFDLKIATPAWQATSKAFSILEIFYPTTSNSSYLFRTPDETTLSSEQNGTYTKVEDLPYDQWLRIGIEVVPTTPIGALRLLYDGRKVFEDAAVPFQSPTMPRTDIFVGLGRFNPPSPAIDVLYDNVTIEQIP